MRLTFPHSQFSEFYTEQRTVFLLVFLKVPRRIIAVGSVAEIVCLLMYSSGPRLVSTSTLPLGVSKQTDHSKCRSECISEYTHNYETSKTINQVKELPANYHFSRYQISISEQKGQTLTDSKTGISTLIQVNMMQRVNSVLTELVHSCGLENI